MTEFPLVVRFRTDQYPTLVPVDSEDTVDEAADKIAHIVDSRAYVDHDQSLEVVYEGEVVSGDQPVTEAFDPVDYVELQHQGDDIPEGYGESHPAWAERSVLEENPEHAKPGE